MSAAEVTFSRGQMCEALWRGMSIVAREGPPSQFKRRVNKMIEFGVPFATTGIGRGQFAAFSAEQAFQAMVGLLLQDSGLPQGDAAGVVKHVRDKLVDVYRERLRYPVNARDALPPGYAPDAPRQLYVEGDARLGDPKRMERADLSVFFVLPFKALHETIPSGDVSMSTFREPEFLKGVQALAARLDVLRHNFISPYALVLEIAGPAWALSQSLAAAGPMKRGRPSASEDAL